MSVNRVQMNPGTWSSRASKNRCNTGCSWCDDWVVDRHVFAIKRAQQRALDVMIEKARKEGDLDRYSDLIRQRRNIKQEIQAILQAG